MKEYILTYQGTKEEAQKLGAFYTPTVLAKKMVDKLGNIVGKTILDPCVGYGNLLLVALDRKVEQGEDPRQAITEVYGNEFDAGNLSVCIENIKIWAENNGVEVDENLEQTLNKHFHQGDALTDEAYNFEDNINDL